MTFQRGRSASPKRGPVSRNGAWLLVSVAFIVMVSAIAFSAARTSQSAPAGGGMGKVLAAAGQAGAHARPGVARPAVLRPAGHSRHLARRQAPAGQRTPTRGQATPRRHAHPRSAARIYTVRPDDTLSSIAWRLKGWSAGWVRLYQANRSVISDPGLIYPGQVLRIPGPAAAPGAGHDTSDNDSRAATTVSPGRKPTKRNGPVALGGTLGCASLAALWERAGGSPSAAITAASIAMAESSGRQYATGLAGERGYWQIHPGHGALSTYDPYGNARAAVILSADGTNWSPWTTYISGAYSGRCPA